MIKFKDTTRILLVGSLFISNLALAGQAYTYSTTTLPTAMTVGDTPVPVTITLTNTSGGSFGLGGAVTGDTNWTQTNTTCVMTTPLANGASCTVTGVYNPKTASSSSNLLLTSKVYPGVVSLATLGSIKVSSGTGPAPEAALLTATWTESLPATSTTNVTDATATLTVSNRTGAFAAVLTTPTWTKTEAADFPDTAAGGTCTTLTDNILASGDSCTYTETFKPLTDGAKSLNATVNYGTSSTAAPAATTTSTASTPVVGAPTADWTVKMPNTSTLAQPVTLVTLLVSNTATDAAPIVLSAPTWTPAASDPSQISNEFPTAGQGGTCTELTNNILAANATCTYTQNFQPLTAGTKSLDITVNYGSGKTLGPASGPTTTTASAASNITVALAPNENHLQYTAVRISNDTAASQVVTITENAPSDTTHVQPCSTGGSCTASFVTTHQCADKAGTTTLASGAYCDIWYNAGNPTQGGDAATTGTITVTATAAGLAAVTKEFDFTYSNDLYVGGLFTTNGDASVTLNDIARYNAQDASGVGKWYPLGAASHEGVNGEVNALAVDQFGDLYAGGKFTTDESSTTLNHIARWDGTAWQALPGTSGTAGVAGDVNALAYDPGDAVATPATPPGIVVGGNFTGKNGDTTLSNIAEWDNTAGEWYDLSFRVNTSGMNAPVNAIAYMPANGSIGAPLAFADSAAYTYSAGTNYVGGAFTSTSVLGAAGAHIIAKVAGVQAALGAGLNGDVNALALANSGLVASIAPLWAGGKFTDVSTGSVAGLSLIGAWTGSDWTALANGGLKGTEVKALLSNVQRLVITAQ